VLGGIAFVGVDKAAFGRRHTVVLRGTRWWARACLRSAAADPTLRWDGTRTLTGLLSRPAEPPHALPLSRKGRGGTKVDA
jgi:hypothetical protein